MIFLSPPFLMIGSNARRRRTVLIKLKRNSSSKTSRSLRGTDHTVVRIAIIVTCIDKRREVGNIQILKRSQRLRMTTRIAHQVIQPFRQQLRYFLSCILYASRVGDVQVQEDELLFGTPAAESLKSARQRSISGCGNNFV
jgi:hypothetical protein